MRFALQNIYSTGYWVKEGWWKQHWDRDTTSYATFGFRNDRALIMQPAPEEKKGRGKSGQNEKDLFSYRSLTFALAGPLSPMRGVKSII